MRLSRLQGPETCLHGGAGDPDIGALTSNSRAVVPGTLFAAMPGTKIDGARFIPAAVEVGAAAILCHTAADSSAATAAGVPVLQADEPRLALSKIAARFYPRQPRFIVAITGTNGKTSIAEFTRQIFASLGHKAASLGTIGVVKPDGAVYGSLTTPDPITLHETLQELHDEGITHLALEASSHGLDQYRLDGVRLTAGAFNNLGRDHLDYHPTVEAYFQAKLGLFTRLLQPGQTAVINLDGGAESFLAARAAEARGLNVVRVGSRSECNPRMTITKRDGFRQFVDVHHEGNVETLKLELIGDYQAGNATVAAALAISCGANSRAAIRAMGQLTGVRGRLDVAGELRGALVVVDYAHKPQAMEAALGALRPFASGRLICLFGCGGDRDRGKRPIMGKIAAERSEIVIITDDNPRSEAPTQIRNEIRAGAPASHAQTHIIPDRAEAIRKGVAMLRPGDALLVAGKGHETGQIVGDRTLPFSDHEEVAKAIAEAQKT